MKFAGERTEKSENSESRVALRKLTRPSDQPPSEGDVADRTKSVSNLNVNRQRAAKRRYARDVMKSAAANHMWLNAFACIRPSDELKMQIGAWVLAHLNEHECTIRSDDLGSEILRELGQRELIVRFNKS